MIFHRTTHLSYHWDRWGQEISWLMNEDMIHDYLYSNLNNTYVLLCWISSIINTLWSILLITSESKWCIQISRSLFLYYDWSINTQSYVNYPWFELRKHLGHASVLTYFEESYMSFEYAYRMLHYDSLVGRHPYIEHLKYVYNITTSFLEKCWHSHYFHLSVIDVVLKYKIKTTYCISTKFKYLINMIDINIMTRTQTVFIVKIGGQTPN